MIAERPPVFATPTVHIALTGFMAAGKTTVGRHVARELGLPFVDTDDLIIAKHGPVPELFARHGDAGFRALELEAVRDALAGPPAVVALGGGAIAHAPTRAVVAGGAVRVYLEISAETLLARVLRSPTKRPLLGDQPTIERVRELLALREPVYREAEVIVRGPLRTKGAYAREIARRVDRFLARRQARRP